MDKKIKTGLSSFDELLGGGFTKGELVSIAGRPAMGKTAFMLSLAESIIKNSENVVAIFSLEMPERLIKKRYYCVDNDISYIEFCKIENSDDIASSYCKKYKNLIIDDTAAMTLDEIKDKISDLVKFNRVDIIFIDYLQLICTNEKKESRFDEYKLITKKLKEYSTLFNVSIVAMSMLYRYSTSLSKIPQVDSYDVNLVMDTNTPDKILFIHRDDYYLPRNNKTEEVSQLILAKNIEGEIGSVNMRFLRKNTKFEKL